MKISIIGAGPTGSFAARLLAEKGHEVTIYEDHKTIGEPVQCTGLLTKTFLEIHPIKKEFLVNTLKKVKVIAPNNAFVEIPLTEYVIDRTKFDQHLANEAINAGAQIQTQHRFITAKDNSITIKYRREIIEKKTDILIGADGPLSAVAKSAGIYENRKTFIGHQAIIKGNFQKETFETYFGKWAKDFFAWIVPESETTARVGLQSFNNVKQQFDSFTKHVGGKIIGIQAGPIPFYTGKEIFEKENTFLVGDAAGLTKATTGGGIYSGMLSSKILAECIQTGKNYTKALKPVKKMLWLHKMTRHTLNNCTNKDYNKLIQIISKQKIKNVLTKHTREYPAIILAKILWHDPLFGYFLFIKPFLKTTIF